MKIKIFVDETGNISVPDQNQFGFGYCVLPEDEKFLELEEKIRKLPSGKIHVRELPSSGRHSIIKDALSLVEDMPSFFGGAYINSNPQAGLKFFYDFVTGKQNPSTIAEMEALIKARSPTAKTLIAKPKELLRETYLLTRINFLCSGAVRIPVIRLLRRGGNVSAFEITIVLGMIGDEKSYMQRVAQILPTLRRTFSASFEKFKSLGFIKELPRAPINIEFASANVASPIFGFADLFGWIGQRLCSEPGSNQHSAGVEIYEMAKAVLTRAPFGETEKFPGILFSTVE